MQNKLADYNRDYGAEVPLTLVRVAGKQLLQYNRFDSSSPTLHTTFYTQLRSLNGGTGYPRLTENVGVSFGAPTANPNTGQEWLELRLPVVPNDHFYVTGSTAQPGSFLPRDLTDIWGRIGPLTYELDRKSDPTFIPYASALDLRYGASTFDLPLLYPSAPNYHNTVPDAVISPLLKRLGYGVPPPTQAVGEGPGALQRGETGWWSAAIAPGPGNGYTHNWEYRILCPELDGPSMAMTGRIPPGEVTPNLVTCGQWQSGGVTAKFSHRSSSAVTLEIRVRVSGGGASVTSQAKQVYVSGGGWNPDASLSEDAASLGGAPLEEGEAFGMEPSRPHPVKASGEAHVRFILLEAAPTTLVLVDLLGREVRRLHDGPTAAGLHDVRAETTDLPVGMYVLHLTSGARRASRSFVITP